MNLRFNRRSKTPPNLTRMSSTCSLLIALCCSLNICLPLVSAHDEVLRLRDECQELEQSNKCECMSFVKDIHLQCPKDNTKIEIKVQPGENVMIECYNMNYKDYKLLPKMSIGNAQIVKIENCPLPGHLSIGSILQELGVTKYTRLLFGTNNDLGTNITREHLSGLHPLGSLSFSSSNLLHMPSDLFADDSLRNLTWIDLRSNNVALPADIFSTLENLEFIELGCNRLKTLPRGIFRNQKHLQTLNLWRNELHNLTKETFESMPSLSQLDLSNNGIETFQPDIFDNLPNLTNINLNNNSFRSLPDGLFKNNKKLVKLRLMNNRVPLRSLPKEFLANLPDLTEVRLTTDLESIPGDLFANSTGLETIKILYNKLGTLPAELFESQVNLQRLELSHNQLTNLPDDLFRNTKNLQLLKLDHNQLTEITREIFSSLKNLKTLDISNNHLAIINYEAFINAHNLENVNLRNNRLTFSEDTQKYIDNDSSPSNAESTFLSATNLTTLNLRNNSIMYISSDWRYLKHLKELDLSYNNISTLNEVDLEFWNKDQLEVNLTHNQLEVVNFLGINGSDKLTAMISVDMNANPMKCDCALLRFVHYLRGEEGLQVQELLKINVDNLICSSPEPLNGRLVKDLHPMDLVCPYDMQNSEPKRCPAGCTCYERTYDKMLVVNCNNGNRTRLPELPPLLGELVGIELNVENNNLIELPSAMTPGYSSVVKIYASGNNLSMLEGSQLPRNLSSIDLRHNNLKYLKESTINFLNESMALKSLNLSENPWNCDCNAKPLFMFAQRKYKLIQDFDRMVCLNFPTTKFISELSITDICSENDIYLAMGIVIAVMGFLIGAMAACYYKFQTHIKIFLYTRGWFLSCVTEEELDELGIQMKYDAFVSYSHKDEQFVADYLVPQLENGTPSFKLCVHVRDWLVGDCIPDQIIRSVEESRRTIVVLSQNYVESEWAKIEFKAAHKAPLDERRPRLIIIVYGDLENMTNLDADLQAYLQTNTYLKWGDPWFWDKLRFALPHKDRKGLVKVPMKGYTDDKLELIKPSPVTPTLTTPPGETTKNPLVAHLNGVGAAQTVVVYGNGKTSDCYANGKTTTTTTTMQNGHINGAFIINTNAKQSDV
ncbi:toll like receptor [Musca autumnalis]|uniref:toll like receptor n=1 Tax=Musca autumnalis TaxID=221902 RepID=UPI003CF61978